VKRPVKVTVNGVAHSHEVEPRLLLVHFLRDVLGLTGTHVGCDTSNCGACTILMNGKAIKSCTLLAVQADGALLTTVEGLAQDGNLHPIQEGFWEEHGLQCGFCTPGMMLTALDLLQRTPDPTEEQIRMGLEGNLCRCTGYQHIVNSIQHAARKGVRQEALCFGGLRIELQCAPEPANRISVVVTGRWLRRCGASPEIAVKRVGIIDLPTGLRPDELEVQRESDPPRNPVLQRKEITCAAIEPVGP